LRENAPKKYRFLPKKRAYVNDHLAKKFLSLKDHLAVGDPVPPSSKPMNNIVYEFIDLFNSWMLGQKLFFELLKFNYNDGIQLAK